MQQLCGQIVEGAMGSDLRPARVRLKEKRLAQQIRAPEGPSGTSPSRGSLDTWLLRLSQFSQFALFLFTVGTIYFTVIRKRPFNPAP